MPDFEHPEERDHFRDLDRDELVRDVDRANYALLEAEEALAAYDREQKAARAIDAARDELAGD